MASCWRVRAIAERTAVLNQGSRVLANVGFYLSVPLALVTYPNHDLLYEGKFDGLD